MADELVRVLGAGDGEHRNFHGAVRKQAQAALGGFLARLVGVVAEHGFLGIFAEQLDLFGRERRAAGADGGVEPGFVHADDIHVAFAKDEPLGGGFLGHIERKQRAGFFVDLRFGAVDVFGLGIVQHAAAESDDVAAHVDDGHHDAVAEDIVEVAFLAALDEAGMFQFFFGKAAAAQVVQQAGEIFRRIAQAKTADRGVRKAALFLPVAAGGGGFRRAGVELLVKVAGGAAVDLEQAAAGAALLVVLLWHRHPGTGGQLLDGFDIAKVVDFAHKGDGVAARAAAEAVKALGVRIHGEGGGLFVVERAQAHQRAPAAAQADILADQIFDVVAADHFLDIFLRDQRFPSPLF